MRRFAAILFFFTGTACWAQVPVAPETVPAFDVASIKLTDPGTLRSITGRRIQTSPGMLTTYGLTLRACIIWAYDEPAQIIAPDWIDNVRLDIVAKATSPVGDRALYQMLRTLLAKRMGLKAHSENCRSMRSPWRRVDQSSPLPLQTAR